VTDRTYAAFAFFVGLIAFVTGVAVDSSALAILGFLPLTIGGLYLNGIFWAKILDKNPGAFKRSDNYRYYV
jgi:hypothetical protein